jgi:hypothetical protein
MGPTTLPPLGADGHDPGDPGAVLDRLLDLWTAPVGDDAEIQARFATVYADPVLINGDPVTLGELVARARLIAAGLEDVRREVVDVVAAPGRLAFAFRLSGRHVGPLPTPLGPIAGTGEQLDILGIDILQLDRDGRIGAISVLSGLMDVLATAGAIRISTP